MFSEQLLYLIMSLAVTPGYLAAILVRVSPFFTVYTVDEVLLDEVPEEEPPDDLTEEPELTVVLPTLSLWPSRIVLLRSPFQLFN